MMPRSLPRLSLFLTALVFGAAGTTFLVHPGLLAVVGVEIASPAGAVELRGLYGGMELGLAAFFGLAVAQASWQEPALAAQILALGGMGIARVLAVVVGGGTEPLVLLLTMVELAGALLGAAALAQLRSRPTVWDSG